MCARLIVANGARYVLELTSDKDGKCEIQDEFDAMARAARKGNSRGVETRQRLYDIEDVFERATNFGPECLPPNERNWILKDPPINELKVGTLRFPYYFAACPHGTDLRIMRITHMFHKATGETPRKEKDRAAYLFHRDNPTTLDQTETKEIGL